jgi:hypothetical protein
MKANKETKTNSHAGAHIDECAPRWTCRDKSQVSCGLCGEEEPGRRWMESDGNRCQPCLKLLMLVAVPSAQKALVSHLVTKQ